LAANTLTLSLYYELAFTKIALLTGYFLLGVGVAGVLFVASARIWGKRHLFLLGTILVVASSAWGGASGGSYTSLLWARIIQGVGTAPFEALVNATVGDIYFVHVSYWLSLGPTDPPLYPYLPIPIRSEASAWL
jgi:MFS family permease